MMTVNKHVIINVVVIIIIISSSSSRKGGLLGCNRQAAYLPLVS
jgi:hypothetical protein